MPAAGRGNPNIVRGRISQTTAVPDHLEQLFGVMAGLVPAIRVFLAESQQERRGYPRQARAGRRGGGSISSECAL